MSRVTTRRVLLVDDFEDSRFSLSKLLQFEGFEVIEAIDGAEAIDRALADRPDLILMDVSLPVIDGLSATQRIRQHESMNRIPIIAISAHDTSEIQDRARNVGCNEYITKPIDFTDLIHRMSKYLPA